jgi:membrane-associated phospholipid phosphatase
MMQAERRGWRYFSHLRTTLSDDTRRRRALLYFGVVVLVLFSGITFVVFHLDHLAFDLVVTLGLQQLRFDAFIGLMFAVSWPGYFPQNVLIVLAICLLVGRWLGWWDGLFLGALTLFQGTVNTLLKMGIGRPRPTDALVEIFYESPGLSFPSGHVMFYTVFFGFLFFIAWTRLKNSFWRALVLTGSALMVLLVGVSRIFLGAHWVTDVIAAHLISLLILLVGIEIYVKHFVSSRASEPRGSKDLQEQ